MSRRSRTTITLQVRLPLPPGATQKRAIADVTTALQLKLAGVYQIQEMQVKIVQRETHYL